MIRKTTLLLTLVALAAAGTAQAALDNSLLMLTPDDLTPTTPAAYWQDVSGNDHHVTNIAPPAYDGSTDPGGSAARSTALDMTQTFPDSTEPMEMYVQDGFSSDLNPGTGDYSVSFWYYQTESAGFQHTIAMGNDGSGTPGYAFHLSDGAPTIRMQSAAPTGEADMRKSLGSGTGDISADGWHHAVGVFDRTGAVGAANTVSLYVDNVLKNTLAIDPAYDITAPSNYEMLIGGRWNHTGNAFTGYLDDIAMYQGALSAADVSTLYSASSLDANTIATAGITPMMIQNFETNADTPATPFPSPITDATGTYEGTAMGSRLTVVDDPEHGAVMSFPGSTNNHVDFGDPGDAADDLDIGTGSYTVSFWYNATEGNTNTQIVALKGNQGSGNVGWNCYLGYGTILNVRAMANDGTKYLVQMPEMSQGDWHHVALVIDNENGLMKGYVDGAGSGTTGSENGWTALYDGVTFAPGTDFSTTEPLVLGERWFASGDTAYPFEGMLDDFAVWDRALSDAEILDIFGGAEIMNGGGPALEGDMNGDGVVNSADLDMVRGSWGLAVEPGTSGDGNGDGYVNSADLDLVRGNWGASLPASVPEPSVVAMLIAAAMMLVRRRK